MSVTSSASSRAKAPDQAVARVAALARCLGGRYFVAAIQTVTVERSRGQRHVIGWMGDH